MSKDRDIKIKISEDLPDMLIEIPPPIEYKPPTRLKSILFSTLASGVVGAVVGLLRVVYAMPYRSLPKKIIPKHAIALGSIALFFESTMFSIQLLFPQWNPLWSSTIAGGITGTCIGIFLRKPRFIPLWGIGGAIGSAYFDSIAHFSTPSPPKEYMNILKTRQRSQLYREMLIRENVKMLEEQRRREAEAFRKL